MIHPSDIDPMDRGAYEESRTDYEQERADRKRESQDPSSEPKEQSESYHKSEPKE